MRPRLLCPDPVAAPARAARRWSWTFAPLAIGLLASGLLLAIPAWLDRRAIAAMFAWDGIVLIAWFIDLRRLPPPGSITVTRRIVNPLVLSQPATICLELAHSAPRRLRVWIADAVPLSLRRERREDRLDLSAAGSASTSYDVTPTERGDVPLDTVALRYRGPRRLAERWATASLPQTVRVYPDLGDAGRRGPGLISARHLAIEKRRARATGLGRDFESLRVFQPGDELRDVCWTATARRGRLVTRIHQPERSQAVWIVVDAGRLMRARIDARTRLDWAVQSAFALGQVATATGDRVGLLAYGRRIQQRIEPGQGARHLRTLLDALALVRAELPEADHAAAAGAVLGTQKRRALVVWLTDLAETAGVPEVVESASRLLPRHVVVFAVTEHRELSRAAAGVPADEAGMYRTLAAQETIERRAAALRHLADRGALAIETRADRLTAALAERYLDVKQRNLV